MILAPNGQRSATCSHIDRHVRLLPSGRKLLLALPRYFNSPLSTTSPLWRGEITDFRQIGNTSIACFIRDSFIPRAVRWPVHVFQMNCPVADPADFDDGVKFLFDSRIPGVAAWLLQQSRRPPRDQLCPNRTHLGESFVSQRPDILRSPIWLSQRTKPLMFTSGDGVRLTRSLQSAGRINQDRCDKCSRSPHRCSGFVLRIDPLTSDDNR